MNKKLFAAAARFYAGGFAAQPALENDLAAHRYNAACAASLASAGQGRDAGQLSDEERIALRKQAQGWLRAELAAWDSALEKRSQPAATAVRTLEHMQSDPDLAAVRDTAALDKLPPGEQAAWRQFWADVAALQKQAETEHAKQAKP